jgi:ribosomal protein S18 acetylase RimI-like enzyme
MNYSRLYFTKNGLNGFVTMYNFTYNEFFKYLKKNQKISKQFDLNMKNDFKNQEKSDPPKSIIVMWQNNKNLKKKNTKFCILIYKNNYVGGFRYYKTNKPFPEENIELGIKKYIKIQIVYIVPKYRRLGLGFKMLRRFIKKNNTYILYVSNANKKALQLYTKLGFNIKNKDKDGYILFLQ